MELRRAGRTRRPLWVAIADLGSTPPHAARLARLAREFRVSSPRLEHSGPWIKGLASTTALRRMPEARFVFRLDADVAAHPYVQQSDRRLCTA